VLEAGRVDAEVEEARRLGRALTADDAVELAIRELGRKASELSR
jgi:hypothetical protein